MPGRYLHSMASLVSRPTALRLFSRALRLRCPNCGGAPLFERWLRIQDRCPACGLRTERGEEGYGVGAYMFNIMASELLWVAVGLGLAVWTWPDPPWDLLLYGGGILMIVMPFVCYPFSKTIFLAFDLLFRPPEETEGAQ
jgi:uncharacterized protein (DUF983 family)